MIYSHSQLSNFGGNTFINNSSHFYIYPFYYVAHYLYSILYTWVLNYDNSDKLILNYLDDY